jgi:menaquinone-specific isochorismate synthase
VTWLTTIDPAGAPPAGGPATSPPVAPPRDRPRFAGSSKPDLHWLEAVAEAVDRLRDGDLDKVVLARDHAVWSQEAFDPLDLARRLTARFPSCHTFVVEGLVGATPELLLARDGDRVTSRVLAGTTGRADDEADDAALGAALLASTKDRHEHQLAADSVREVLAPRCPDLAHDATPRLLRLDNVQHLATLFSGHLAEPASVLEVVAELHPTAAVGGTPRATALSAIAELEGMERGRYAAPVGWMDANGDGEWGIALRCAELAGARARLFAGVGIVAASLPEDELEETRLKLLAMQAALDA